VTATSLARTAYAAASQPVRTPRGTEYAAFQSVTARLSRAAENPRDMATRAAAVHENRRLWTLLATDLADPENALPQSLRAQLLYLAEFSLLQSGQALRQTDALAALIDINTAVMRGLSGITEAA